MQKLLVSLIDFYQRYLSFDTSALAIFAPGGACRYEVTCSEYTRQAVIKYGTWKGTGLGFKRFLTCNPFTK